MSRRAITRPSLAALAAAPRVAVVLYRVHREAGWGRGRALRKAAWGFRVQVGHGLGLHP